MYEGFDMVAFLLGLPLGMLLMGIILFIQIRRGKKERRYDERYTKIHQGARSTSWYITAGMILASWTFVILYEPPGTAFFIMTILWIAHVTSYGISVAILNHKM